MPLCPNTVAERKRFVELDYYFTVQLLGHRFLVLQCSAHTDPPSGHRTTPPSSESHQTGPADAPVSGPQPHPNGHVPNCSLLPVYVPSVVYNAV
ncbi:uncharacterized [Tachysurus ichikawai]